MTFKIYTKIIKIKIASSHLMQKLIIKFTMLLTNIHICPNRSQCKQNKMFLFRWILEIFKKEAFNYFLLDKTFIDEQQVTKERVNVVIRI